MSLPAETTKANGGKSDSSFRYDVNAKQFPTRKELPQIEGQPPGALVSEIPLIATADINKCLVLGEG